MDNTGLSKIESKCDNYTWCNRKNIGTIYYRIYRVLGNMDWFLQQQDAILYNMEVGISYHVMLCLKDKEQYQKKQSHFMFINVVT